MNRLPRRYGLHRVLAAVLLLVCAGARAQTAEPEVPQAPAAIADSGAPSGAVYGTALGDSGFNLGGYAAVEAADELGADAAASFKSLSVLLSWQGQGRWSFFGELEGENLITFNAGELGDDHEAELVLERLHVDYAWSDALQFRIGKFLTPIGRWNVIHAAPLTWTTSRPLITESTFPTNATGAMARGVVSLAGRALEWSVYTSPGEELAPEEDSDPFKEAYGLRLDYDLSHGLQLGLSFAEYEQKREKDEHKTLYGIDFLWQYQRFELSGEWAYRTRTQGGSSADESGAYVQAVAPLYRLLYGVVRYETFDPAGAGAGLNLYVSGLTWRFRPGWAAKLEYRIATDNSVGQPEGWRASLAVLF